MSFTAISGWPDTIYRAGRITFAEINRRWLHNNMSEGKPIPLRAFHKHREAVEEFFRHTPLVTSRPTNTISKIRQNWSRTMYPLAVEQFLGQ